jgi:hypothetical protein
MRIILDIRPSLFILFALAVCATATKIVNSAHFMKNLNVLAFALTADFTLVLPAFFYIFVVRRKGLPAITLVPVFILSIVIAGFILPAARQSHLDLVKKLLPLLELVALGFIAIKIRTIIRHYRETRAAEIHSAKRRELKTGDYVSIALFGAPRLMIDLKQPIKVTGLFGMQKEVRRIALTVDDEKRFRDELNERLARFAPTA